MRMILQRVPWEGGGGGIYPCSGLNRNPQGERMRTDPGNVLTVRTDRSYLLRKWSCDPRGHAGTFRLFFFWYNVVFAASYEEERLVTRLTQAMLQRGVCIL